MYQDHSLGYGKRNSRSSMFRIVPKFKKEKAAKKTSPQSGRAELQPSTEQIGHKGGGDQGSECVPSDTGSTSVLILLSNHHVTIHTYRC